MIETTSPVYELDIIGGVPVHIKRDDLLHPSYGGNKWRKLKYHHETMLIRGQRIFLTFGGPFSNHLYACAAFAARVGLQAILLVRGEVDDTRNPVLKFVRRKGARVVAISRQEYSRRHSLDYVSILHRRFPHTYIIPEGGDDELGLRGCREIVAEVGDQLTFLPDRWIIPAGTGCTARGVRDALEGAGQVSAIACVDRRFIRLQNDWQVDDRFTCGGLAQWDDDLISTMLNFEAKYGLPLDPIYTAKAWHALMYMIDNGEIAPGESVLFLHTGGMPGRMAFNYRNPGVLPELPPRRPAR